MSRRARLLVAFAASIVITLILFAPLVRHLDSAVPFRPADESSSARNYWQAHHVGKTPFSLTRDPGLDAPEGEAAAPAVQIANALQPAFVLASWRFTGWLGAFNLFVLVGFAATLFAMFALLDSFGLHPIASAAGSIAFASSQWAVEQILFGHVAFAQLWVFPLLIGTLMWARNGRPARAVAPGLALAVAFYAFSYLGLFASALTATFLVVVAVQRRGRFSARDLRRLGWGAVAALAAALPIAFASRIAPSGALGLPPGSRGDLNGASLQDYLLPSTRHVVYGALFGRAFGDHVGETVVFFGFTVIGLAVLGAYWTIRRWSTAPLPARLAVVLAPVGLWASLPAYAEIAGHRVAIPDPAFVIGTFVQWWRIYTRFAVLVGLALVLLAAFALSEVARRKGPLVAALLAALIVVEALPGAPLPTTRLQPNASERWLAAHPGGIVAFYPLLLPSSHIGASKTADDYIWGTLYEQVHYGHPLFSLPQLQPIPNRATQIRYLTADPSDSRTAAILAAEHVRYVVVRRDVYKRLGLAIPTFGTGFQLVAHPGSSEIYRVEAQPTDLGAELSARQVEVARDYAFGSANVAFGPGFYPAESYNGYEARWMSQNARLVISPLLPQPFVLYQLTIRCFSNATPRTLSVWSAGHELATFSIPTTETVVTTLVRLPAEKNVLTMRADPGPQVLSSTDSRDVSVYFESVTADPVKVVASG